MLSYRSEDINKVLCMICIVALPAAWMSALVGSVYRTLTILLIAIYIVCNRGKVYLTKSNISLELAWTIYMAYCFASAFWGKNINSSISNSISMLLIYCIMLLFSSQEFDKQIRKKVNFCWLIAGQVGALLFLLGERADVGMYTSRTSLMIAGTATDPNEFSSIFIISIALSIYYLLSNKEKVWMKLFCIVSSIMQIYAVFLCGSRGALISIVVTVIIAVFLNIKPSIKTILFMIVSIVIIYIVLLKYIIPLIPEDIIARLSLQALVEDQGSGRMQLWFEALDKIWNGPIWRLLLGYGHGGLVVKVIGGTSTMHNQLLQQLANYGMIGLILFLWLLWTTFQSIRSKNYIFIPAFWGMMIMSMTITMGTQCKPYWVLLLMGFCGDNEIEKV